MILFWQNVESMLKSSLQVMTRVTNIYSRSHTLEFIIGVHKTLFERTVVPLLLLKIIMIMHSVESPSMVDPQWDIWYWGSKWNLHTVCWSGVGCEWGTTSVYFGITYVCFIPSRLPVFAVEPQYLLQDFLFLSKVSFEGHIQYLQEISCWFKIWMGFVGPILNKLWTSSIWGFLQLPLWWTFGNCSCKHAGHHSVTTGACSPPHLTCLGLCSMAAWKLNGPICAMMIIIIVI